MGMAISGDKHPAASINVTPMIDVLLVLIIIFMVITPLAPRGLEALLPQNPAGDSGQVARLGDIVVTVRGDGTTLLNSEALNLEALRVRLLDLFRNGAQNVVFVRGGKDLKFERVAEVLDLVHAAGVYRVALMTN